MYNVHNCNVLYNNAVRPDIFEDLHFTHIENTSMVWAHTTSLNPTVPRQDGEWSCICVSVDFDSFYHFLIIFWNSSDSVVFYSL